jgi:ABC-type multidrug transport system fused ATPase/permease subunit
MAPVTLTVDTLFAAMFAPILGVFIFWFLQLFFIELQKRMLERLRHHHEAFCRFTNYIGMLFQSISQALGYTVTRSGIASFQATVNYGKVEPKKEKEGVFEWVARSFLLFGPFFIPAGLILLVSVFVIGRGFVFPTLVEHTFVESLSGFFASLSSYAKEVVGFLIDIDLLNPVHVGWLFVLVFLGLGIRPSYIGKERKEKIDILYDLRHIKDHLVERPVYLLVLLLFFYLFYIVTLFLNPVVYVGLFTLFGWMSLTAIIAILMTFPLLLFIKATDWIQPQWKIVPFLTVPVSYIVARVVFLYVPTQQMIRVSLLVMVLSTVVVTIALLRYKRTNRFKTPPKMKHMRVADGKKRASKK